MIDLYSRMLKQVVSKAAAIYHLLRGGWDGPNCARPTRAFGGRALREQRDRPSYPALFFSILFECELQDHISYARWRRRQTSNG